MIFISYGRRPPSARPIYARAPAAGASSPDIPGHAALGGDIFWCLKCGGVFAAPAALDPCSCRLTWQSSCWLTWRLAVLRRPAD